MEGILKKIKAFAFDVDGVFTDGKVFLQKDEFVRTVNIKDGYAVQYCIKQGYPLAIITGGNSETVRTRFGNLGVTDIYLKSSNKLADYEDFRHKYHLDHTEIAYMGDDIPDYEIMKTVGFPVCPADAVYEIKEIAGYVSDKGGGEGCVREIIEMVLKSQDKWLNNGAFTW